MILKLVFEGKLPPEAMPPLFMADDPEVIFAAWLNKLAPPIKDLVLTHITECNLEEQFLKVSKTRCTGLRVP